MPFKYVAMPAAPPMDDPEDQGFRDRFNALFAEQETHTTAPTDTVQQAQDGSSSRPTASLMRRSLTSLSQATRYFQSRDRSSLSSAGAAAEEESHPRTASMSRRVSDVFERASSSVFRSASRASSSVRQTLGMTPESKLSTKTQALTQIDAALERLAQSLETERDTYESSCGHYQVKDSELSEIQEKITRADIAIERELRQTSTIESKIFELETRQRNAYGNKSRIRSLESQISSHNDTLATSNKQVSALEKQLKGLYAKESQIKKATAPILQKIKDYEKLQKKRDKGLEKRNALEESIRKLNIQIAHTSDQQMATPESPDVHDRVEVTRDPSPPQAEEGDDASDEDEDWI